MRREICGECGAPITDDGACDCTELLKRGQVNINVVGMPEFDELMDHIYEYGTTSEGVTERAIAFARAVIARYAPQRPADEVVFVDGVGAGRSSVKSCRDGVQWIRIKNRVYWPLSDADAQRLHSACCGNGHFDGPTTPTIEGKPR